MRFYGCYYMPAGNNWCGQGSEPAPVGTAALGAGRWAHLDLAGNTYQWTLDWYANIFVDPCADCAYLTPVRPVGAVGAAVLSGRVERGSDFESAPSDLVPTNRSENAPGDPSQGGVRCARAP